MWAAHQQTLKAIHYSVQMKTETVYYIKNGYKSLSTPEQLTGLPSDKVTSLFAQNKADSSWCYKQQRHFTLQYHKTAAAYMAVIRSLHKVLQYLPQIISTAGDGTISSLVNAGAWQTIRTISLWLQVAQLPQRDRASP